MRKIFQLDDRFATGEPTIQLVLTSDGRGGRLLEKRAFDTAASSPAYEYLKTVTPKAGHSVVLVNALGAYETYDDNRNGDSFPDRAVNVGTAPKCGHAACRGDAWITRDEGLSQHYKSFEKHGGIYKHHANKDSSKSLGTVMKAVWNDKMQRVELLLEIVHERDKDLAKKIGDGEYPAVSMGCHVKWDVCSICGHRAPTRKDYCDHARLKMRQVLPNGEKVCVHNPSPRFFDISFVFRPADPTGFMLKKVADTGPSWIGFSAKAGELADAWEQKVADEKKLSDIRKQLLGKVVAQRDKQLAAYRATALANAKHRRRAEDKDLAKLSQYPLSVIASTFAAGNVALSTGDVASLFLKRAGLSTPDWLIDRVVAVQPLMDALRARDAGLGVKVARMLEVSDRHVDPRLFPLVHQWVEKYAGVTDYLKDKLLGPDTSLEGEPFFGGNYRASAPPKTDILTMTDPYTGHVYQTTRGAGQKAHHADMKHKILGSALLSAGYMAALHGVLHPKIPKVLRTTAIVGGGLVLGAGTGFGSYNWLMPRLRSERSSEYLTDQGISVPGSTEFVKVSALTLPAYLDKVAFDVLERVRDAPDPLAALQWKVARYAPESALARFLLAAGDDMEKAAALCSGIENAEDEVDLDALGERLGSLLLS